MNSSLRTMLLRQAVRRAGRTGAFTTTNAIRAFSSTVAASPALTQLKQIQQQTTLSKRFLAAPSVAPSTPPVPSITYDDLVKETINKMVTERVQHQQQQHKVKPIADADLKARFDRFKKVFEEAELCLIDLKDAAGGDDYADECQCAKGAVENAFTAYVDLLEDLRRANEEQLQCYSEVRNSNACNLKRLRQQLDELLVVTNDKGE